ncbi:MAG: T9SS type A sorting domain-containing protein [Bacteroidota bacterium]
MMKQLLAFLVLMFSCSTLLTAQDTLDVAPGQATLETAINNDVNADGSRKNPNRVYKLESGGAYLMVSKIIFEDASATLTIVSPEGGKKALIVPSVDKDGNGPVQTIGDITGSLKLKNLYVVGKSTAGHFIDGLFYMHTDNQRVETENCVFDMVYRTYFDYMDVSDGAVLKTVNTYFRDLDDTEQQWGARVMEIKSPADTIWMENTTISNAGIGLVMQGSVVDFFYVNHCSFINAFRYPLLVHYFEEGYITNNLFVNGNMMGECPNIYKSGQDPDGLHHGMITVDTLEAGHYYNPGDLISMDDVKVYVADNINYYNPLLDHYYNGEYNDVGDYPVSQLGWFVTGVVPVENTPTVWMNDRTAAFFTDYANIKEENNHNYDLDPQLVTPGIASKEVVDHMASYMRNRYGFYEELVLDRNWNFGDRDALTVPGIETEDGNGIYKISDLVEDFTPQNAAAVSNIDGFKIGALHWIDSEMAQWDSEKGMKKVLQGYDGTLGVEERINESQHGFSLGQNHPNPFSATTSISFTVPRSSHVTLKVYDVAGREVTTLVDGVRSTGTHSIELDASGLHRGLYFYRLKSGEFSQTRKLILAK